MLWQASAAEEALWSGQWRDHESTSGTDTLSPLRRLLGDVRDRFAVGGGVRAGAAVDRVGIRAAVQGVVAGPAKEDVVARVAIDRVVALAADQDVIVGSAIE